MGMFKSKEEKENEKLEKQIAKMKEYNIDGLNVVEPFELTAMSLIEKGSDLQSIVSNNPQVSYLQLISMQNKILIRLLAKQIKEK